MGAALLAWTERHAAEQGGTRVGQTVADQAPGVPQLFEAHGYRPLWTSWILSIDLAGPVGRPALPPGVSIRDFRAEDARAVHGLIEEAFGGWAEPAPTAFGDWAATPSARP